MDLVPWDMGTFGSRTTPTMAPVLKNMAAAAREALVEKAATQWQVPRERLTALNGKIADAQTGKSMDYGEQLTKEVSAQVSATPPTAWKIAGKSIPKAQARAV